MYISSKMLQEGEALKVHDDECFAKRLCNLGSSESPPTARLRALVGTIRIPSLGHPLFGSHRVLRLLDRAQAIIPRTVSAHPLYRIA